MSHHLTHTVHLDVHQRHIRRDGAHTVRQIVTRVSLKDFEGEEHRRIAEALHSVSEKRSRYIELTIHVCVQCGFIEQTTCHHGMSYWTHRPGCGKFNPAQFGSTIPEGLYQAWQEDTPDRPDEDCSGCLLVCPVCRADGT